MMRSTMRILMGAVAAAAWCGAQEMGLLVNTPNTVYVTGEPVVADLRVHNRTTRMFVPRRGAADALLTLTVTRENDRATVEPSSPVVHVADMSLPSGETWQGRFEVSRVFPVRQPGRYLVRLVAVHNGMRYESSPRAFDVVPGFEITKVVQVFPGDPPLQRELRLAYWVRNQMEELFLQVAEKPETRHWRTYSLGPVVRTTPPKVDIAPDGMLTIVHRATPDVFVKSQVRSAEGEVTYQGQEKLLDPVASASKRMVPFQTMAMEDAIKKRDEQGKKRWWWPFGGGSRE